MFPKKLLRGIDYVHLSAIEVQMHTTQHIKKDILKYYIFSFQDKGFGLQIDYINHIKQHVSKMLLQNIGN